jgi:hypothetical protein
MGVRMRRDLRLRQRYGVALATDAGDQLGQFLSGSGGVGYLHLGNLVFPVGVDLSHVRMLA